MKSKKIELLRVVRKLRLEADEYIDKVPNDLSIYIMDNTYANSLGIMIDRLLEAVFKDMYEEVSWFLYEFTPKDTPQIWLADKTPITLLCDEDFYEYLKEHC